MTSFLPDLQMDDHNQQPQQQPHLAQPQSTVSSTISASGPSVYQNHRQVEEPVESHVNSYDNGPSPFLFPSAYGNNSLTPTFNGVETLFFPQAPQQGHPAPFQHPRNVMPFNLQYQEDARGCENQFFNSIGTHPTTAVPPPNIVSHPVPSIEPEDEASSAIKINLCYSCHEFVSSFASYEYTQFSIPLPRVTSNRTSCMATLCFHSKHCASSSHRLGLPASTP